MTMKYLSVSTALLCVAPAMASQPLGSRWGSTWGAVGTAVGNAPPFGIGGVAAVRP